MYLQALAPYRGLKKYEEMFARLCAEFAPHRLRSFHFQGNQGSLADTMGLEVQETVECSLKQGLLCEAMEIAAKSSPEMQPEQFRTIKNFVFNEPALSATFLETLAHLDLLGIPPNFSLSDVLRELPLGFVLPDIRQASHATLEWMHLRDDLLQSFFSFQSQALAECSEKVHRLRLKTGIVVDPHAPDAQNRCI